eukprot:Gregarina_sp_Poly_1__4981@NODE_263_length_10446_cov_46_796801_g230_i0_p3_GENE_NODE_263_length_10446_cov_46_796801_g230_i0NODE_263_length_10446_cov_46_796801_g230_i0_p3_ORF_typecomplete_len265_score29_08_NODE_263_length_10446_cov_46_796801_g230_i03711165
MRNHRIGRLHNCHDHSFTGSPQLLFRGGSEEGQDNPRVRRRNHQIGCHHNQNHHNQNALPSTAPGLFRGKSEEVDGAATEVILETFVLHMSTDSVFTREWPENIFLKLSIGHYGGHTNIGRINHMKKRAKFGSVLGFPVVVDSSGYPLEHCDWLRLEVIDPRHSCKKPLAHADLHLECPVSTLMDNHKCKAGLMFKLPVYNEKDQQAGCVALVLKIDRGNSNRGQFIPDIDSIALRGSTDLSSCSECRILNEPRALSRSDHHQR